MDQEVFGGPAKTNSQIVRAASVSAILIVVLALSYFFLDRQFAVVLHSYTRGVPFFVWLTYIASPLAPLASILAAFIGGRALVRGYLTQTESALLRTPATISESYWQLRPCGDVNSGPVDSRGPFGPLAHLIHPGAELGWRG